jgi:uncharacterized protein (TIGR02246 family)
MRLMRLRNFALGIFALGIAGAGCAASTDDDAIRAFETAQEAAWNAHDAHAYVQFFAPDADIILFSGWWWKSRDEAERKLTDAFAVVFAESRLHIDEVSIKSLSPDMALAHVRWSMTGARKLDGAANGATQGISTQLLRRSDGRWLVQAVQSGGAEAEQPFPTIAPVQPKARRCIVADRKGRCVIGG